MTASGKSLLDRFDAIIEKNFNNPEFGIDEACRELGTSRSQLFRLIKTETQLSTSLYIRKRKLEKAKELLRSTDKKTSEIAYLVGIDSPQNFSKYFNQEFGLTPTAFRKQVADGIENISTGELQQQIVKPTHRRIPSRFFVYGTAAVGLVILIATSILFIDSSSKKEKVLTNNPAALKEYLAGKELILQREKVRLEESVVRFTKAIELDSNFADAYAHLGYAYHLLGEGAFIDEVWAFKLTEENSLKAIRLDTENALAYANLANSYRSQFKWEQARTAFEISLQHDPDNAMHNYWMSLLLRTMGDAQASFRYSSKAVELDPLHHIIYGGNITAAMYAGDMDKAEELIEEGKVLFNDSWSYYWGAAEYYARINDYETAIKYMDRSLAINPGIRITRYTRAYYHAMAGHKDEAIAFVQTLPETPDYDVPRSAVYAGLGDKETSMSFLQKAADNNILMHNIKSTLFTQIHRNDPRFIAILEKFNLNQ